MGNDVKNKNPQEGLFNTGESRRKFLGKFASSVFGGLVASGVIGEVKNAHAESAGSNLNESAVYHKFDLPKQKLYEDVIVRMMRDIQRALEKPIGKRKWEMVIDLRKCVGCDACTISCVAENKLPPGVVYRPVLQEEVGKYPNVGKKFLPRPCMQCDQPPCVPVCPVEATWKRPDGIVVIDYDQCIGCRYCITACPYSARTFDFGTLYVNGAANNTDGMVGKSIAEKYETDPSFEYSKLWKRKDDDSPIGNARKCHFCIPRIDRGMLPECVVTCIGRATYFGDTNDPNSLVSELKSKPNAMRLKEYEGTKPSVYYLL